MARDGYDAGDEHDIAELRRAMRQGTPPKFAGSSKPRSSRGCVVVMAFALAVPVVAAVAAVKGWG